MPLGNVLGSGWMLPSLSRETCQQSSMTMYWYPASFMPEETIESTAPLISVSLTLQPNLFQVFQPIGGVAASWFWAKCVEEISKRTSRSSFFMSGQQYECRRKLYRVARSGRS